MLEELSASPARTAVLEAMSLSLRAIIGKRWISQKPMKLVSDDVEVWSFPEQAQAEPRAGVVKASQIISLGQHPVFRKDFPEIIPHSR
jgi:hypothetical protein